MPLKRELKPLLERCAGKSPKYKRTRGLARNLLKIYRKLSPGSQSETGERMIERLLSAFQTCRLQRRSLFAYVALV